jgi:hypothetical protein
VVERLLSTTDRRLDTASPIVQGRVLDGSARLTAVIPPVSDLLSATIRRYALRRETLDTLVALGSLTAPAADFLRMVAGTTSSVVISGQPGAGKTSMLAALLQATPVEQCIRCCEEVRELHVPLVHGSYYEARPPGLDGSGEIPLRQLVKVILATLARLSWPLCVPLEPVTPELPLVLRSLQTLRGWGHDRATKAGEVSDGDACTCGADGPGGRGGVRVGVEGDLCGG